MADGRYLLVDVREPNEVAVEAYPGAVVVPLSGFDPQDIPDPHGKQVVFACRSGKRSVTVSSGGTEALTSAILAVVEPGDEVVVFQPVYDSYLPIIRQAGGKPRLVRLEPPHWRLTEEALRSVFNHKTKAVLFNNPLNPAAVVYPREDLELLARFCQEFDTIAICDEVWEHVIFDGREHIPLITIPGMRERTINVGSAGKIFSLTGWKIGFVCAAPPLLRVAAKVHQFLTFTTAPNLQAAVAYGLGKPAA